MIQDIAPHTYDNGYKPTPPDRDSIALYFQGRTVLVKKSGEEIAFPTFGDLEKYDEKYTYLFSIDEKRYYLTEDVDIESLTSYSLESTEIFRTARPQYRSFAGITAHQLYKWYQTRKFCGRCGAHFKKDKNERMLFCEKCGNIEYPKICPAVIIGVIDKERILLSKYARGPYKKYALLAGFVEVGETAEETVVREVMEEVGLKVKNIRYYKSQPWSFSDTLLLGYFCDLDGDGHVTLDENELALAEWFDREDVPVVPLRNSLTNEMMIKFKNNEI